MLICVMMGPCPYQTNIEGIDGCVINEGDCEYQMVREEDILRMTDTVPGKIIVPMTDGNERFFGSTLLEYHNFKVYKKQELLMNTWTCEKDGKCYKVIGWAFAGGRTMGIRLREIGAGNESATIGGGRKCGPT